MVAPEVAQRHVVDGPSQREPDKIDRMTKVVFDLPATSNPPNQGKQEHFSEHRRVDRWLPECTVILGFPVAPIEPVEDLIENPNRMILGNPRFQRFRKEHELVSGQRCILPVTNFRLSFTHRSSMVRLGTQHIC